MITPTAFKVLLYSSDNQEAITYRSCFTTLDTLAYHYHNYRQLLSDKLYSDLMVKKERIKGDLKRLIKYNEFLRRKT